MTVKDLLMTYEGNMDYIMMLTIKCLGHRTVSKFTTDKNGIYIRLKK